MSEDYETVVVLGDMCITNHENYWCVGKKCVDREEYILWLTVEEYSDGVERVSVSNSSRRDLGAVFGETLTFEQTKCVMEYWEIRTAPTTGL